MNRSRPLGRRCRLYGGLGWPGIRRDSSARCIADAHAPWAARLVREEAILHAIAHGRCTGETALLGAEEMSLLNEMANDISFALDHLKKEQQVYYLAYFDALDLRVVAAGVETAEQASLLRLLRCHEIQGYLFSPAVPAEQIEVFLREGKRL